MGIGASAGGLDALERFFDNLPENTGMAFVVVQHLSPSFKSIMDELLGRHTRLPVCLVEDGMQVEPDRVYLIPPGKEMIISDGRLLLSEREQELTLPIDVFFRSLAQDLGPRAVAIVLSGGGSDGSRGIRAVHEAGGLVIVQDTQSAQFDGMPKTARDAGVARWVLAPHAMPAVLMDHAKERSAGASRTSPQTGALNKLDVIYAMLEEQFGIDFTHYKPSTVTRRIERRLALSQTDDIEQYVARLRNQHDELDLLYRDLLIGVTRFFRNEEAFERLENEVLPDLLRRGSKDVPFRAWIAGCATGEEAYSLAISIQEAIERTGERPMKIFATDVHRGSLARASRGIYEKEALQNVSPERIERFFRPTGSGYQVVPDLRQMVVFAPHNVIKDAPFTRVDLVSCRNMLIYLQPAAQQKALSLFHFALNRGGVLFLGPSESPGHLANDYETVDKHWRIYRKSSDIRIPVDPRIRAVKPIEPRVTAAAPKGPFARYSLTQLLGTYDTLLGEFMPPSFLVDERGELVHSFAGASRFLKPRDGRHGLDLLDLVESGLKMVLVGGMKRAAASHEPIVFNGVVLEDDAGSSPYKVTLRRFAQRSEGTSHLLISLESMADGARSSRAPETVVDLDQVSREQLVALEAELSSTKESLQAAIEELETGNEELQASNEELLSSNEELQSTNEELQSVNEELYTVNAEHQRKIAELVELTNDMDSLLESTEVGVIFLDAQLNIRKFTPQIAQTFNLVPHDVGRPIETFTHTMQHPELVDDLRRCLETGERIEREIRDARDHIFFLRILPYRAKGIISGVVLTLIDVNGLKAAEDALFRERYLLDSLLYSVPDAIYFKELRGRFIRVNHAMADRLGLADPREAAGKSAFDLLDEDRARMEAAADGAVIRSGQAKPYVLEKRAGRDGADQWDMVSRLPLKDREDRMVGLIGIFRDVTREKRAEETIQEAVRRRDQFLAMLSHELRNPLSAMVTATQLLKASDAKATARLLDTLDRQSAQMARLLDDLLEASRVTQNKIELRKETVDLRAIARAALEVVRNLVESRKITLDVELDARPVDVHGDPARLQQIQVNLLNNAAKYTPREGHVWLKVAHEDGVAVIRVRDDGVGIRKEMLESVFDLFVQSTATLDRADGGLGVGLTLVRSLVGLHGGTVTASSDGTGKGSEFVVRLPLATSESVAITSGAPRRPPPAKGSKVVIVEDHQDNGEMLAAYLEGAGFHCESATDGPEGLALIQKQRPDVAIIDVGLPGMDGLELARRLRRDQSLGGIYLVALTGYGQAEDRVAAQAAGFDEHFVKPVDLDRLVWRLLRSTGDDGTTVAPAPPALPAPLVLETE